MAKTKTSARRAPFSLADAPIVKLKDPKKAVAYSPSAILRDRKFTARALFDALMDGDRKAFNQIMRNHFEALNTAQMLKTIKVKPRTFYKAVSDDGNPTMDTVMKLMKAFKRAE